MAQAAPAPSSKPKKRRGRWLLIGTILLVVILGVVAATQSRGRQKATAVTVETVARKTLTQLVTATGKIQPEIEVKISPEVAGEIVELPFREGASVQRGDLLVRINADNYRYQVEQREADLAAARAVAVQNRAQLQKAEEDLRRTQGLYERQLISESEFVAARTSFEVAKANHDNALAQIRRNEGLLKQANDQLGKTTINAPIDGTISLLSSEVGERVVGTGQFAGTEILRVANLAAMEVRVEVNENDVVNVKIGDRARLTVDAFPNQPFRGEVTEIASTATTTGANTQQEVTNFQVKIRIVDNEQALRPGMSATAEIETRTVEDALAVPIQAVTVRSRGENKTIEQLAAEREKSAKQNTGAGAAAAVNERAQREAVRSDRDSLQRVVFVVDGGKVRQVPVETGIADTTHMEIKSGLEGGEQVVSGSFNVITRVLKDGMDVKVEQPRTTKK